MNEVKFQALKKIVLRNNIKISKYSHASDILKHSHKDIFIVYYRDVWPKFIKLYNRQHEQIIKDDKFKLRLMEYLHNQPLSELTSLLIMIEDQVIKRHLKIGKAS